MEDDDHDRYDRDPTPAQIRAICEEIRKHWPASRYPRYTERIEWELHVVKIEDLTDY